MSENIIYADLNLAKSTRPRLQQVTDVQGPTYAEVKTQALDINTPANYTASGKSCSSRSCVAVFLVLIILLLALAVCLILLYLPTASSSPGSEMSSNTCEEALETDLDLWWSGENGKQNHTGCPPGWNRHGGKCYFFSQSQEIKDWNASRKECIDKESDLVIVDNKDELKYLLSQSQGSYYLLGLIHSATEMKWKWLNYTEHSTDMFHICEKQPDYFCTVVGHRKVSAASCSGSTTTKNMCEKAANVSEEQQN